MGMMSIQNFLRRIFPEMGNENHVFKTYLVLQNKRACLVFFLCENCHFEQQNIDQKTFQDYFKLFLNKVKGKKHKSTYSTYFQGPKTRKSKGSFTTSIMN